MTSRIQLIDSGQVVGILLAAGKGTRFDASGINDKLMQRLPNGDAVVTAVARTLLAVLPNVVAVIRPGTEAAGTALQALGCAVTMCPDAENGMAASLVHGLSRVSSAAGWVIALGDMPHVQMATVASLADAIKNGAGIAAPVHRGRRGNPVAFSRVHLPRLLQLSGDLGARKLLREFPVHEIELNDSGIFEDIDTPDDLERLRSVPR